MRPIKAAFGGWNLKGASTFILRDPYLATFGWQRLNRVIFGR
jgi:hypothetical protein